jgi:uncharacterized protein GlcG (DUF336 family)
MATRGGQANYNQQKRKGFHNAIFTLDYQNIPNVAYLFRILAFRTVRHGILRNTKNKKIMAITLEQAEKITNAAKAKAKEINVQMNIAIVDEGANLKAFHRMDNAWLGSVDISIKKAKTARFFDMPTGEIGKLSQPGGPLYNIEHSNGGLISFPGGVLLKKGDVIIGAIGVSGGSVEQDHAVASAGAAAVNS